MVTIRRYEKVMHVEEFVPSVVEPSFGIGRIMYALFEHRYADFMSMSLKIRQFYLEDETFCNIFL